MQYKYKESNLSPNKLVVPSNFVKNLFCPKRLGPFLSTVEGEITSTIHWVLLHGERVIKLSFFLKIYQSILVWCVLPFYFSTNGAKAQYKGFNCMFDTNIICFYEILYQLSSLATSCWLAVFTGFFFFFTILGIFLLMVIALHFLLTTAPLLVRREGLVRRGRGGRKMIILLIGELRD